LAVVALVEASTLADDCAAGPRAPSVKVAARRGSRHAEAGPGADARHRPDNQFWLVSTRHLPHDRAPRPDELQPHVWRQDQRSGLRTSTLDELFDANDPRLATTVLVHGNDTDHELAIAKGLKVYQELGGKAPGSPLRLIVWSWPSDHIPGSIRRDVRIKARRAEIDAHYLAAFVERLDGRSASLVGYSFGARTITGALHLLGGGRLDGRALPAQQAESPPRLRAILLAAAVDDDWLLPGRPHGRALNAVEQFAVLVNPDDRVLRFYRFLSPGGDCQALGTSGFKDTAQLGDDKQKVVQINVAGAVGNKHGWTTYIAAPTVVGHVKRLALLHAGKTNEVPMNAGKSGRGNQAAGGG
jgi:hypothetical protein